MFRRLMAMETEALWRLAGDASQDGDSQEADIHAPVGLADCMPILSQRFAVCASHFDH